VGSLKKWAGAYRRWRCGWFASGRAILCMPFLVVFVTILSGETPQAGAGHGLPPIAFYLTLFPFSLFIGPANVAMLGGPLNREGDWRGWLLPHLFGRFGDMRAAFAVGAVWACWHLPYCLLRGVTAWRYATSCRRIRCGS
jgi:uncharacterized protein